MEIRYQPVFYAVHPLTTEVDKRKQNVITAYLCGKTNQEMGELYKTTDLIADIRRILDWLRNIMSIKERATTILEISRKINGEWEITQ
jgi:hypothetical protein